MKYNLDTCKKDLMLIAHHLGVKRAGRNDNEYANSLIEKTQELLIPLNLNISLKDSCARKDKLPKIAKKVFATMGFAIQNNPISADEQITLRLLEKSY